MERLILFARRPELGKVKTRLTPPLRPQQALQLYQAFLADQCRFLSALAAPGRELELCFDGPYSPETSLAESCRKLALTTQRDGDLGQRLLERFRHSHQAGSLYTLVMGSDSPTLPATHVFRALTELEQGAPAVIAPAEDGGFVLLGLREPLEPLFREIPWGGSRVFETIEERAGQAGLQLSVIEPWYDVDDLAGLLCLQKDLNRPEAAERAPKTAFFLKNLAASADRPLDGG